MSLQLKWTAAIVVSMSAMMGWSSCRDRAGSESQILSATASDPVISGSLGSVTFLPDAGLLQALVTSATVDPKLSDNVDLEKANSVQFVEPALGSCVLTSRMINASQNGQKLMIMFMGDKVSCRDFLSKASQSMKVTFTNVPFLNGGSVNSVTLKLTK